MKHVLLAGVIILASIPLMLSATLNAGIVNGVWFSSPTITADTEITLYTAVQNYSGNNVLHGTVAFLVDGNVIDTTPFTVHTRELTAVSATHTFNAGERVVSAYITTVNEGAVRYTIVPERTVTVIPSKRAQATTTNATSTPPAHIATNIISDVVGGVTSGNGRAIIDESGAVIATVVTPITENVAERLEETRDTLLTTSPPIRTTSRNTHDAQSESAQDPQPSEEPVVLAVARPKIKTARNLFDVSVEILQEEDVSIINKVSAIGLSALALFVRWWWVWLVLIVLFAGWRLVRRERIR